MVSELFLIKVGKIDYGRDGFAIPQRKKLN